MWLQRCKRPYEEGMLRHTVSNMASVSAMTNETYAYTIHPIRISVFGVDNHWTWSFACDHWPMNLGFTSAVCVRSRASRSVCH